MLNQFAKILKEDLNVTQKSRILLAVSGGIDSVVMAHLFKSAGFKCGIAHVNYQLRGDDSELDRNHVVQLAQDCKWPIYLHEKKPSGEQGSIQMEAREIRYSFFNKIKEENDFHFIATAHHLNDSYETALFNLIKGTGFRGIKGIRRKNGFVIRPLLKFSRANIFAFAKTNNLQWRDDTSNSESKYLRNKIRNQIIPFVEEINQGYLNSFQDTSEQFTMLENFVLSQIREADWIEHNGDVISISIDHLKNYEPDKFLLWEVLRYFGFNFSQFKDVIKSLDSSSGKQFESDSYILEKDRDKFYLSKKEIALAEVSIPSKTESIKFGNCQIDFERLNGKVGFPKNKDIAFLNADKIKFPLKIRRWKQGDKFTPFGMTGLKKVSDFLIDSKVPMHEKREQLVLESKDQILWLVGRRIDDNYKIESNTESILKITVSRLENTNEIEDELF